jgi:hypothetical protein
MGRGDLTGGRRSDTITNSRSARPRRRNSRADATSGATNTWYAPLTCAVAAPRHGAELAPFRTRAHAWKPPEGAAPVGVASTAVSSTARLRPGRGTGVPPVVRAPPKRTVSLRASASALRAHSKGAAGPAATTAVKSLTLACCPDLSASRRVGSRGAWCRWSVRPRPCDGPRRITNP